jgi:3-phosphoshikimate 1-carboxyvinyltransferase
MTLAITALAATGPTTLTGIASWRVKETDRIAAMATELRKLGVTVDEDADRLTVHPTATLRPAAIDTYDDHRMAMCFSLVSLLGTPVTIRDPACVRKTFPGYFDALGSLVGPRAPARVRADARAVPVVAIDGPAASGKGTIAARVAAALGFHLLDSGALYRLVALQAIRRGVGFDDAVALVPLARDLDVRFDARGVALEGEDVSEAIRAEAIGEGASRVAVHPGVRRALLDRQQAFRQPPGLVADGRDMGTVVFPDAATKVFVTATPEARAERRQRQLARRGVQADLRALEDEIRARDRRDRRFAHGHVPQGVPDGRGLSPGLHLHAPHAPRSRRGDVRQRVLRRDALRAVAPLAPAGDAVVLDTTALTIDEATAFVLERCARRAG